MSDRAFDRYGRILGSQGYDYVISNLSKGKQPEEIVDQIITSHPQFDRSEVRDYVSAGVQARSATDSLNNLIDSTLGKLGIQISQEERDSFDWQQFVQVNPKLFGVAPEGDRFKYTFEFGETTGLPLIKVSITSPEFLSYFDAYRQAYERSVEICMQYPEKFGLKNSEDCEFLFSRAYAPESRW